ncbi:uncharacterized protein K452DRAFT_316908 [Aplosporella prunicola CBS 121167]|uniref:INO80 complex subunit F domain-containing protein n=1 Tax=Aplosporella prunicola CBS 121167 TaxID=1176127 RepID=A0A6A6BJ64_9PEZI|nr:uncharacterized protein K452DRAFT_316908 [Aplosporella prunicola CBS 121167]KAF2144179.1 hypothetical protein K452DRAFT_316908 [Aplosporella prunicola CBS 121167]
MPPADPSGTPLPPSVEAAYYRKCIALKRRLNEIEANNDAARVRKRRLDRAIMKMRLERAFLMERLSERMAPNVDESDRSTSPPPTPQEKPTRSKRTARQKTPPAESHHSGSLPPHHSPSAASNPSQPHLHAMPPLPPSTQSTPDPHRTTGGLFNFSGPGNPPPPALTPLGVNGTPGTPFSGHHAAGAHVQHPGMPITHGLPLPQPQFLDGPPPGGAPAGGPASTTSSFDRGSGGSGAGAENGGSAPPPAGAEYGRPFAPAHLGAGGGATGEMMSAGPEIRTDANGERRIGSAGADAEMRDAPGAAGFSDAGAGGAAGAPGATGPGGGFTAVNR